MRGDHMTADTFLIPGLVAHAAVFPFAGLTDRFTGSDGKETDVAGTGHIVAAPFRANVVLQGDFMLCPVRIPINHFPSYKLGAGLAGNLGIIYSVEKNGTSCRQFWYFDVRFNDGVRRRIKSIRHVPQNVDKLHGSTSYIEFGRNTFGFTGSPQPPVAVVR